MAMKVPEETRDRGRQNEGLGRQTEERRGPGTGEGPRGGAEGGEGEESLRGRRRV